MSVQHCRQTLISRQPKYIGGYAYRLPLRQPSRLRSRHSLPYFRLQHCAAIHLLRLYSCRCAFHAMGALIFFPLYRIFFYQVQVTELLHPKMLTRWAPPVCSVTMCIRACLKKKCSFYRRVTVIHSNGGKTYDTSIIGRRINCCPSTAK